MCQIMEQREDKTIECLQCGDAVDATDEAIKAHQCTLGQLSGDEFRRLTAAIFSEDL